MLNRLFGLGHHAIISGDHQNNDIGRLSATCTHRREGRVSGCIQEGNDTVIGFHMVSTDMLGDTTRFTGSHPGFTNMVKQRGFTMINMAHNGHNRRP